MLVPEKDSTELSYREVGVRAEVDKAEVAGTIRAQ